MKRLLVPLLGGLLAACGASAPPGSGGLTAAVEPTTRYAFANACYALRDNATQKYVATNAGEYAASAGGTDAAEPFYLKPSALGKYLLYGHDRQLLAAGAPAGALALASADDSAEWTVTALGDATVYPDTPAVDTNPDPAFITAYRAFVDPNVKATAFTLYSKQTGAFLAADAAGVLQTAAQAGSFSFQPLPLARCAVFAEAGDNVRGATFSGKRADGTVLGYADTHLHAISTTFLGGAKPGWPFHKFGVTHALADCSPEHGPQGSRDTVGALFTGDTDGHATDGWPTFTDWPSRTMTTHEATYWKWIERAWKSGLRLTLNYAVDNATLCEIQRNAAGTPSRECNEMKQAGRELGTAYALMDYVDAQYGGRGAGWYRIVFTPAEARRVIEQGKLAVLLGIEISNLLDCTVTFNPANTQDAFEEAAGGPAGQTYGCASTETGAPNEIATQLQRLKALGVVGLYTVHEFDNAFGGSDIFDGAVLNLGTKENSGGVTSGDKAAAQAGVPSAQAGALGFMSPNGAATGEYWSTYDCPAADAPETGGFVFPYIGVTMTNFGPPPPACVYEGRGGRHGGKSACYPSAPQCNGRSLTPLGLYAWSKMMQQGFVIEVDHLGSMMKDQLLDLAAAQSPNYPVTSGHAWMGLTANQARRIFAGGGLVYPSINSTEDFTNLWKTVKPLWRDAGSKYPFAFGFGSDTNGMSPQMAPRATIAPGREVTYPFTLFKGAGFDSLPEFSGVAPLTFDQPEARDPDGNGRTWSEDVDGNAHYGMAADFVQELRLEGSAEQVHDLYNSAEAYLQFWERLEAASAAARQKGVTVPAGLLRAAPVSP